MFKLKEVVPWGRSFEEYLRMFALTSKDLRRKILGCADGPAGFNAGMKKRGVKAISCDPLYQFSDAQIKTQINKTFDEIMKQMLSHKKNYIWKEIKSLKDLGAIRMRAMGEFLKDFENGKKEGRYIAQGLPVLSFPDKYFDLAVCSHFLFLYSDHLSLDFHRKSIIEMCRVAKEVRIFPNVGPIAEELGESGYNVSVCKVKYEFRRGADKMLKISIAK
jgi:hypothetical protein